MIKLTLVQGHTIRSILIQMLTLTLTFQVKLIGNKNTIAIHSSTLSTLVVVVAQHKITRNSQIHFIIHCETTRTSNK